MKAKASIALLLPGIVILLLFQNCSGGALFNRIQPSTQQAVTNSTGNGGFYDGIMFAAGKCADGTAESRIQYSLSTQAARVIRSACIDLAAPTLLSAGSFSVDLGAGTLNYGSVVFVSELILPLRVQAGVGIDPSYTPSFSYSHNPVFATQTFPQGLIVCSVEYTAFDISFNLNSVRELRNSTNTFRRALGPIRVPDPSTASGYSQLASEVWYAENSQPTNGQIAVVYERSSDYHGLNCVEYAGVATSGALVETWSGGGLGANPAIALGQGVSAVPNGLVVAGIWSAVNRPSLAPPLITIGQTTPASVMGDLILDPSGIIPQLVGLSQFTWTAGVLTFRPR